MVRRKNSSRVWDMSDADFTKLVLKYATLSDIMRALNYNSPSGNYEILKNRMKIVGVDTSPYIAAGRKKANKFLTANSMPPLVDVLVEQSSYNQTSLKRRLIADRLIPYVCALCGCYPIWKEIALVLILDHINGIHNDNRLTNLRFLCPNCDSQQPTYAGRNRKIGRKSVQQEDTSHGNA